MTRKSILGGFVGMLAAVCVLVMLYSAYALYNDHKLLGQIMRAINDGTIVTRPPQPRPTPSAP